ncbi:hypothetical protein D3C76_1719630 [compost metagenome]
MRMLIATPRLIILMRSEVPPELIKGNVIPVRGIKPMNMPIFSKIWYSSMATMPTIKYGPPGSRHSSDIKINL